MMASLISCRAWPGARTGQAITSLATLLATSVKRWLRPPRKAGLARTGRSFRLSGGRVWASHAEQTKTGGDYAAGLHARMGCRQGFARPKDCLSIVKFCAEGSANASGDVEGSVVAEATSGRQALAKRHRFASARG